MTDDLKTVDCTDYTDDTIENICQNLYEEEITSGSSLLYSDIENAIIGAVKDYVTWNGELRSVSRQQKNDKIDSTDILPLLVDGSTVLHIDEWSIIKPVARAHCDIIHARRMEGAQGLGVQPGGMSVSEANQVYSDKMMLMKKEAFACEPYTIDLGADYQNTQHQTIDKATPFTIAKSWGWM